MSGWAPGTVHYKVGTVYYAVESSVDAVPAGAVPMVDELLTVLGTDLQRTKQRLRPTVVFACDENGVAADLTPLREFPPGTSHADALAQLDEGAVTDG